MKIKKTNASMSKEEREDIRSNNQNCAFEMRELSNGGQSVESLAEKFGCSMDCVQAVLSYRIFAGNMREI